MLPPTDQDWRLRVPPTADPDTQTGETTIDGDPRGAVQRQRPDAAPGRHACPVCAFASDAADDVYAHLLPAHRKCTIGAALLER